MDMPVNDYTSAEELSNIEKSMKPHGRKNVAKAIVRECTELRKELDTYEQTPLLKKVLDLILDPRYPLEAFVEWITPLFAGGRDHQDFWNILKEYGAERHCGLAWPTNYVAYRCRTCSYSPSMSLCADCFRNGDHEGHDYNMFKSRSGGACDCGYSIVHESGHCKNHGSNAKAKREGDAIPYELICVAQKSMPSIIHRLVIQLRKGMKEVIQEIDCYLDFLHKLASRGEVVRKVMIDALTNRSVYTSQISEYENHPKKDISDLFKERLRSYAMEKKNLVPVKPYRIDSKYLMRLKSFDDELQHFCFIEELMFWVVVYEFPQKLVCLLLGFLMDSSYRHIFAQTFVNLYPRMVSMLSNLNDHPQRLPRDTFDQLTRRVLQISVQIYNDEELSRKLCEDCHTLHTLIYSLVAVIGGVKHTGAINSRGILRANPLAKTMRAAPLVVSCEDAIIRDRHFSSFTEDLNALLQFYSVANILLQDDNLLETWIEMVAYFQTMSPNLRELTDYTLYENNTYATIFAIESEFCLTPLWSLLSHLKDASTEHLTTKLSKFFVSSLRKWFKRMGRIVFTDEPNMYLVSFHLPLHRMFVATIRNAIFVQNIPSILPGECDPDNSVILKCRDFFVSLMMNPLQAIVLYHEIRCNLWTRNGMQIVSQAMTYIHCAYCYSTIDLDMFTLRLCASNLDPDLFLRTVFERFHIWEWFRLECKSVDQFKPSDGFKISSEQVMPMIENSLAFLIQLLTLQIDCDVSNKDRIRKEMVALVSISDSSYSHLVNMLPDIGGLLITTNDDVFEALLEELTRYTPPTHDIGGNLHQGTYSLKEEIWDTEYDPAYVMYRVYHRRDYQMSLERFFQHCKKTGKIDKSSQSTSVWPPFRIPPSLCINKCINLQPLLRSNTLLGTVYNILYKSVYMTDVTDNLLAYAIHLLYLACRVSIDNPNKTEGDVPESKRHSSRIFISTLEYHEITQVVMNSHMEQILGHRLCIKSPLKRYNQRNSNLSASDEKLPTVRSAIDLNFDTWFPFESVIDNMIVMIEDETLVEQENQAKLRTKDLPLVSLDSVQLPEESTVSTVVGLVTDESSDSGDETECDMNRENKSAIQLPACRVTENATVEELPDNSDHSGARIEALRNFVTMLNNNAVINQATNQDGQSQTDSIDNIDIELLNSVDQSSISINRFNALEAILASGRSSANRSRGANMTNDNPPGQSVEPMDTDNVENISYNSVEAYIDDVDMTTEDAQQINPFLTIESGHQILELPPAEERLALPPPSDDASNQQLSLALAPESSFDNVEIAPNSLEYNALYRTPPSSASSSSSMRPYREPQQVRSTDMPQRLIPLALERSTSENRTSEDVIHERYRNFFNCPSVTSPVRESAISRGRGGIQRVGRYRFPQVARRGGGRPVERSQYTTQTPSQTASSSNLYIVGSSSNQASRSTQHSSMKQQLSQTHRINLEDSSYHDSHNNCTTESILTLLLRLHSHSTQQANSYRFDYERASSVLESNLVIGGGDTFVGRILDLVCLSRVDIRKKAEIMSSLIWNQESESCLRQDRQFKSDSSNQCTPMDTTNVPLVGTQGPSQKSSTCADACKPSQREILTKQDRRRKAKEYQNKLMADFASKQKAFLKKYDSNPSSNTAKSCESPKARDESEQGKPHIKSDAHRESPKRSSSIDYECCICGNGGPSEPSNPFGQVVLLQSTSVLGHAHLRPQKDRQLPCEEYDCKGLKEETFAKYTERRIDTLSEHFVENSWLDSLNIGVAGGVHIQSCGHFLHIKCHQSYIKSMDTQEDRRSRIFDAGEFACPVCRQLANSVLPIVYSHTISKEDNALVASNDLSSICCQVASLLANKHTPNQDDLNPSAAFCSDLTNATLAQYRSVRANPSMHSLFLFLASIARTNLECEVVVNLSNASPCGSKKPCFVPLFHFLALNARTLISDHWYAADQVWSHLTNFTPDDDSFNIKPVNSEVPLLLKDPIAIMIQLLFAISPAIVDQTYFLCITQILFNLCATQSICLLLAYMRPDCRPTIIDGSNETSHTSSDENSFEESTIDIQKSIIHLLALVNSQIYDCLIDSEPPINFGVHDWIIGGDSGDKRSCRKKILTNEDLKCIESRLKLTCLPFLRIAALLQHHLYKEPLPHLATSNDNLDPLAINNEFANHIKCLKLGKHVLSTPSHIDEDCNDLSLINCLTWPTENPTLLIKSWSCEFLRFSMDYIVTARTMLFRRPLIWHRPSLMKLPQNFNDIFMFYYRKKCSLCSLIPKDVAICLVCGAPVCFRISCCKERAQKRQVASEHSLLCGANTALFLAVHSSSIIVIRGNRACIWGSVYLDSHGEEDNGLKRGRPLFLVQERYNLLEQQWLTHSFDHTRGKRWIFLQEAH